MSDFRFELQDVQDGDRLAAAQELAKSKEPSFSATWKAAVEAESLTKSIFSTIGAEDYYDPGFRLDEESMMKKAEARGIPPEYLSPLSEAHSEQHADQMLNQIQHELEARNTLSAAGWKGVSAQLLVGMLDPVTLIASIGPAAPAAWTTKAGAMKAVIKAGMVAGASNAAVEAALAATQYTRDPWDVVLAGVTGFGLGGAIGGMTGLFTKNAQNLFHNTVLRRVEKDLPVEPQPVAPSKADNPLTTPPRKDDGRIAAFTKQEADTRAFDELSPQWMKDLEGETGTVNVPELKKLRHSLGLALEEKHQWIGTFGRVPGHKAADEVASDIEHFSAQVAEIDKAITAHADLEGVKRGLVPERFKEAHTKASDEMLANSAKRPLSSAIKFGDDVEWEGPAGIEKGRIIHDSGKGRMIVQDATGNIREFRAGEHNPEEEGAKFLGGSIGSAQIGMIEDAPTKYRYIKIGKWQTKIPARLDAFSYFDRSTSPTMRHIAGLLLDDPVGKEALKGVDGKDIYVANPLSASELSLMDFKRYYSAANASFETAFHEFAKKAKLTVGERVTAAREFATLVSRVTRDTTGELARANPEAAKAAREMAATRTSMLKRMQELGVEGADEVAENANYLNRRYKWDRIAHMTADPELRPQLERLIGEAIRKVRPEVDEKKAKAIGKSFIGRLRDLQTNPKSLGFLSDSGYERLAASLRQGGHLEEDEINDILGFVFNQKKEKAGDKDAHARLKKRAFLDETHSVTWVDSAGKERKLSFDDLLENDIRVLNQLYFKQTSGLTAMASKGFRSKAEYEALKETARQEMIDTGMKNEKVLKQLEDMDRVVKHLLGQPMYDGWGSTATRGMRILRNFNVANNLAQVGFAQLAETGQLLALKTVMALRTNMSAYDDVMKTLARGKPDANLVRDLRAMGSVAAESEINRPFLKDYDPEDIALGRAEDLSAKGAYYTLKASGLNVLTEFQRDKIAKMYSQRLLNIAVGAEKMDDGLRKRLATNGLEGDDLDAVLSAYKKHVRVDEDGTVVGIDYDTWEHADRRSFDSFRLAVFRESHRSIQEVSIGASPLWMNKESSKLLFQFRSFVINAYTKQSLYGMAHFDFQTFMTWTFSMMAGSLAYAAQQSMNFANNPRELEKRLDPWQVGLAGFQRAAFSSVIPMAVDSAAGLAFGESVFKYGRSSNLATGAVMGIPSLNTAASIAGVVGAASQAVLTNDYLMTQKDFGYAAHLLPQFYGIRTLLDTYKQELPRRNYLRAGE